MKTEIFRKTSIDRVNSPEQLNEYIRVANPGVWLILSAIIVLLVGAIIWGVFGTVETAVETCAVSDGENVLCYVSPEDLPLLEEGISITAEGKTGKITEISASPIMVDSSFDDYILFITGFSEGDFCYVAEAEIAGLGAGTYSATVTTDEIHPISFIIH